MNDNPTLRPFESYLDEVAADLGFDNAKEYFMHNFASENLRLSAEAANRMLEDAFKAQKEILAGVVKTYKENGWELYTSSILEAPTPKTINQNKN